LDEQGNEILAEQVLELTEAKQVFRFDDIAQNVKPVLSFLRGYSAPVKVIRDVHETTLDCLIQHDDDPFVRWESMQQRVLPELLNQYKQGSVASELSESIESVFSTLLSSDTEPAMLEKLLSLPSESYFADFCHPIKPQLVREIRENFATLLAKKFESQWLSLYKKFHSNKVELDGEAVAARSLKNLCLAYLVRLNKGDYDDLAAGQYTQSDTMTDSIAAVSIIADSQSNERQSILDSFFDKWQNNALVLDKWLAVQASSKQPDAFEQIQNLIEHPSFSMKNPNKVRSLLGAFTHNLSAFHQTDGAGYQFYADRVLELDKINPQVAARMVGAFNQWKSYDQSFADLMKSELERINAVETLSKDVKEIVSKALV